ncbi:MAG: hypothetical protein ACFB14_14975 [Leptolyngbyaceae cyanobacterium]
MKMRAIQLFLSLGIAATVVACGGATDSVDDAGETPADVEETVEDAAEEDEGGEGGEGGED